MVFNYWMDGVGEVWDMNITTSSGWIGILENGDMRVGDGLWDLTSSS